MSYLVKKFGRRATYLIYAGVFAAALFFVGALLGEDNNSKNEIAYATEECVPIGPSGSISVNCSGCITASCCKSNPGTSASGIYESVSNISCSGDGYATTVNCTATAYDGCGGSTPISGSGTTESYCSYVSPAVTVTPSVSCVSDNDYCSCDATCSTSDGGGCTVEWTDLCNEVGQNATVNWSVKATHNSCPATTVASASGTDRT
ncbi:MAG: hypothetical protein UW24_C0030G0007, partial [Parcubacteria group bacterium GW2011_GWA2_44_12]